MRLAQTRISDEIPTSSMADIAFLLIVYFMLTLSFAISKGLDFKVPQEDERQVIDPVESVLVEILADSQLRVDGLSLPREGLLAYLQPILRASPDKPVILKPDDLAPYGSMVEIFDLLRGARDQLQLARDVHIALPTKQEITRFGY